MTEEALRKAIVVTKKEIDERKVQTDNLIFDTLSEDSIKPDSMFLLLSPGKYKAKKIKELGDISTYEVIANDRQKYIFYIKSKEKNLLLTIEIRRK